MFTSTSMKATIHLGPNNLANLEIHKKTNIEEIDILFNITQKLISEQSEENVDVKLLESSSPSCTRPVLSHDQVDKRKKYVSVNIQFYAWDR